MPKRYVSIWFRHLTTDWLVRRQPELQGVSFVLAAPERGRMVVHAASKVATAQGISAGMVVADCRAIFPALQVFDDDPAKTEKLLTALAIWLLRYTPIVAIDMPDGIVLDMSGCPHLWGGEQAYLKDMLTRLRAYGYDVRAGVADTIGTAWAVARFGDMPIVASGDLVQALLPLPATALRLDALLVRRLSKLGLHKIGSFISMPRTSLSRRFGKPLLMRLDQALGQHMETLVPICPVEPYQERLPSLEPIRTAAGIEIALQSVLERLCMRLAKEDKGLRRCVFKCYRIDGNIQQIEIGTSRPSRSVAHICKLFENKLQEIEPDLGIELFLVEAPIVEALTAEQEALWNTSSHTDKEIAELLDRISGKVGAGCIRRYLPAEHFWPERAFTIASSLAQKPQTAWRTEIPRPLYLLPRPEAIEVTVPIPDYPPMLFIYKDKLHTITKADGPERIEQEWWIEDGLQRDYYCVEDEEGARFWLFRLGQYGSHEPKWFMHGFFH